MGDAYISTCDDTRAKGLLSIVLRLSCSGDGDARDTRRRALEKLGKYRCSKELLQIIDELAMSGDCDARETRRRAMELL